MKRATFEADGKERIGVVSGDVIFTGTPGGVGFAFRPP